MISWKGKVLSIDWFLWEKLEENPMIMGKSGWFPVKMFLSTNPLVLGQDANHGAGYMELYIYIYGIFTWKKWMILCKSWENIAYIISYSLNMPFTI